MIEILFNNIIVAWLVFGSVCVLLEAMAIPGVGFLFAGLAALTVGGLLNFEVLSTNDHLSQVAYFLGLTCAWAAILWIPLQKFRKQQTDNSFSNIIGDTAIVTDKPLTKGKIGTVKWSGTKMKAKLDDNLNDVTKLNKDDEVIIKQIDGNTLIVTTNNGDK